MGSVADDTRWMDATAQAELVAGGEVSPRELTEAAIERIEDEVEPVNWARAEFAKQMTAIDDRPDLCRQPSGEWSWACSTFNSADGQNSARSPAAVAEYRRATQQWWADGWDLLLSPTLAEPPVRVGELDPLPDDPLADMRHVAEWVPCTPPGSRRSTCRST